MFRHYLARRRPNPALILLTPAARRPAESTLSIRENRTLQTILLWVSALAPGLREHLGQRSGQRRTHLDGAGELRTEIDGNHLHIHAGLRRLDHPAVAQVDGDMRDIAGLGWLGSVEEQVAWR